MVRMVGVPHRPDHLRGREAELARLDELLDGNEAAAITPALVGQGGVGKTQLAALYANDRAGRYPGGVFWLTMADPSASNVLGQLVPSPASAPSARTGLGNRVTYVGMDTTDERTRRAVEST